MDLKFIMFCFNLALALDQKNLTRVLTKTCKILNDSKLVTTRVKPTFQGFIQDSSMWVDKSLIIKEIWEENDKNVFMVTAPPRWGKTMILSMIGYYHQLAIEDNGPVVERKTSANYHYFTTGQQCDFAPLISGEQSLNDEHLANHPVIHIEGTGLRIEEDFVDCFRRMIQQTYQKHSSLQRFLIARSVLPIREVLLKKVLLQLETFENFFLLSKIENLNREFLKGSIKILSELLEATYGRKVIILFDNYDHFISNTYFGEHIHALPSPKVKDAFVHFLQMFMQETFEMNTHLAKGIVTGILPTCKTIGLSGLNNVALKYVFGSDSFYPYYGIFKHEFRDLVSKREINQSLMDNAVAHYDGYHVLNHLGDPMFSTYSAIGFINKQVVDNYWTEFSSTQCVSKMFQHRNFCVDMAKVIRNWRRNESAFKITYNQMTEFTLENFETVYKLLKREINYESDKHRNLIFSFFVSVGFISVHQNQWSCKSQQYATKTPETVDITIPNVEIYLEIKRYIRSVPEHAGLFAGSDQQ